MLQNHDLICLDWSAFLLHWQTALICVTCAAIVLEVLTTYMIWISVEKGSMEATAGGVAYGKIELRTPPYALVSPAALLLKKSMLQICEETFLVMW